MQMMTDKQREAFLKGIREGLDTESACSLATLSIHSVQHMLLRGKLEEERVRKDGKMLKIREKEAEALGLWLDFGRAKSELQLELLGSIRGSDNFKAQQWLLERMNKGYGSDGLTYLSEDSNGF